MGVILAICAALALPAGASATNITPTQEQQALQIAATYWAITAPDAVSSCPAAPTITWGSLPGNATDVLAYAYWTVAYDGATPVVGACGMIVRDVPMTWGQFCRVIVHEDGHLVLGPTYFAAVNPADPAHSPDPTSIMWADASSVAVFPPCDGPAPDAAPATASFAPSVSAVTVRSGKHVPRALLHVHLRHRAKVLRVGLRRAGERNRRRAEGVIHLHGHCGHVLLSAVCAAVDR